MLIDPIELHVSQCVCYKNPGRASLSLSEISLDEQQAFLCGRKICLYDWMNGAEWRTAEDGTRVGRKR